MQWIMGGALILLLGCNVSNMGTSLTGSSQAQTTQQIQGFRLSQTTWAETCIEDQRNDPRGDAVYMVQLQHDNGSDQPHVWQVVKGPASGIYEMDGNQEPEAWLCGSPGEYRVAFRAAEDTESVLFEIFPAPATE